MKNTEIKWGFVYVLLGIVLGMLINLISAGVYDLLTEGSTKNVATVTVLACIPLLFLIVIFTHLVMNLTRLRNKPFLDILIDFLESLHTQPTKKSKPATE